MVSLVDLGRYTGDEEAAETYLRDHGLLVSYTTCPHCGGTRLGRIRRQRYKCYGCRREWGVRKGSIFERSQVPFSTLLLAVKLFELDMSVREAARQLGLAYNTAYRLHHLLRTAILCTAEDAASLKGEVELDESYFGGRRNGKRGRGAAGNVPVFGILERGGKVRVEVVQNVKGATLLDLTIKKVKRGSLVYTDRFQSYNGLVSYGFRHQRIDHGKRFANGKVYINGIEGFWSFAKERLMKYHGVDPTRFPFYLKELEFRYNYRDVDLFDRLIETLEEYARVALTE
jgi:transposase